MPPGERNRAGRPTKGEGPRVPYEELDKLLVFGEVVPVGDGDETTVNYPSYRELGERYGVSHSVISEYAQSRNVQRRRKEAQARVQAKVEQKVIEMRARAIAYTKEDEIRVIDAYLAGFEKAIAEQRVRFDNPADFNTMVRLKEFVLGNADSRQEIHASLSLEVLQTRHREMMRAVQVSPAERGEVGPAALPDRRSDVPATDDTPAALVREPVREPHGRFAGGSLETDQGDEAVGFAAPPTTAAAGAPAANSPTSHERAHENVRPSSARSVAEEPADSPRIARRHESEREERRRAAEHFLAGALEHDAAELENVRALSADSIDAGPPDSSENPHEHRAARDETVPAPEHRDPHVLEHELEAARDTDRPPPMPTEEL
jgi:hypothetical protein